MIGRSTDGSMTGMVSMGMLAVELKASTGAKLQIASGFEADIRMKVPAGLLSEAPASIPLWYFDEAEGIWVEDGSASLVNGFYEGKVSHFSFWNTDYKDPVVDVKFKVVDSDGNPVEGALVDTRLASDGTFGRGYTNNQGFIWGIVPQGQVLEGKVFLPNSGCGNSASVDMNIGPFNQGDSICFTVDLNSINSYIILGNLVDCNGDPVVNGYVSVDGGDPIWVDATGAFSGNLLSCDPLSIVEVVGFDLDAFKQSTPQTVDVSSGMANVGTIDVCDQLAQYFQINDGTDTYLYENVWLYVIDSVGFTYIDFQASNSQNKNVNGYLEDAEDLGPATMGSVFVTLPNNVTLRCFNSPTNPCTALSVNVVTYPATSGGTYEATYSGTLYDNNGNPVQVTGAIKGPLVF